MPKGEFWKMKRTLTVIILAGLSLMPALSQGQQPLTNDSILKLTKASLDENTIVTMVQTQAGNYSLGADDLIALKQAGISEKVIQAMLSKGAVAASATATLSEGQAVGVYYRNAETWQEVMPEVVNWQTGGVIKSHVSLGIVKGDVNGRIDGKASRNAVNVPAEFLIRLPEGVEITEYQLVHLHQHHDSREFRTVTGGIFHQSGGAKRDTLPFEYKKIGLGTYTVTLADAQLDRGDEYGLLAPGMALSSHASAQLGKMYTFRVLGNHIEPVATEARAGQ
jgi:hypothetical protein